MTRVKRIGVLTGGGDAPGLNAVIRAVVKSAANAGIECIGLEDSFDGLIFPERSRVLTTARRHRHPPPRRHDPRHDQSRQSVRVSRASRPRDQRTTRRAASRTSSRSASTRWSSSAATARWPSRTSSTKRGMPIVGVPKTIDNDIVGTTMTFGFDTAVAFATDAIDRLHTTAEAHHRVMVVEVMGRYAGWIALYAGVAGGADVVLIPEDPVRPRQGRRADPRARQLGRALQHRRRRGGRACRSAARRSVVAGGHGASVERLGGIAEQISPGDRAADRQGSTARRARPPAARRPARRATIAMLATRFGCVRRRTAARGTSSA